MLKARIRNVGEWKAILNAIGDVVEGAMFIVNHDGITFRGMDPAHIALLNVTFPKSSFEELDGETSFFGLNVDAFKTVINSASNDDVIELDIMNDANMKVTISGTLSMEYNIKLLQKQEVTTPIPKTDYKSQLSLEPNTFTRIISNIEKISEYVMINCNSNGVQFSGKGDIGDAKIHLERGNPELQKILTHEDSSAIYSLEYMVKVIRSIGKASKKIDMEYATKKPIHILFEMPSKTKVEYYLAPRIED